MSIGVLMCLLTLCSMLWFLYGWLGRCAVKSKLSVPHVWCFSSVHLLVCLYVRCNRFVAIIFILAMVGAEVEEVERERAFPTSIPCTLLPAKERLEEVNESFNIHN